MNINLKWRRGLYLMVLFYILSGINHFRNPDAYLPVIPGYLPYPELLNSISGFAEIFLGMLLLFPKTRTVAAYLVMLMLVFFIPVHVRMVETGWCIREVICFPQWVIWLRLLVLQPLLIFWAWRVKEA
ncbi:MAG: hypothetical protein JWQ27_1528 [Ferruginibacter sp.]|nr:hypothetical protein [Ferruginibacter sp.]